MRTTMAGIMSYGSYVPYRRLKRAAIAQVLGTPAGKAEQTGGDGAAAFVFGAEGTLADIEATASITREFLDTWRAPGERFAHNWEERFSLTQAYVPMLTRAVETVLTKAKATPK